MKLWQMRGPGDDIVLSSRARLARNLSGTPFPSAMSAEQGLEVAHQVTQAVSQAKEADSFTYMDMVNLEDADRMELVERHMASPGLIANIVNGALLVDNDETRSVMINEEDHLRIQALVTGCDLARAAEKALEMEAGIGQSVQYAYDAKLGYLTGCLTNLGTGMRVSCMMHLPALTAIGQVQTLLDSVMKAGLTVRGIYGEGSSALGDIYQISNQSTLGRTEEEIVDSVSLVCAEIMDKECLARELLMKHRKLLTEDRVCRAWGILRNARKMSSEEFMKLMSDVRLGVAMGLITEIDFPNLNVLTLAVQPAALQKMAGRQLETEERDALRADYIRQMLSKALPKDEKNQNTI